MRALPRPRHFLGLFAVGLCLLPVLQACGGRSDTEDYLFGDDGSGATGTGASSSDGATGSGATGTGASSSTGARPGDDEPGQGATGGTASGGAASTGGKATGGRDPIGEGGAGVGGTDAGGTGVGGSGTAGSPSGLPISCGDASCDSSSQKCCAGFAGFSCVGKNRDCNGAVLDCSNSDDCPGNTVCCLKVIEAEVGSGSQCKAACLGMGPTRERQLCASNAECASGNCRPTVFGVSVCTRR